MRRLSMEWRTLLSSRRLGVNGQVPLSIGRSEYQRDFDRIAFSSSFRRLQDKTQVVPLPASDFVRTRLTHSLEVSSIGRSLGIQVGRHIFPNDYEKVADLGSIVAAACIAHDLGNPPFGHSGEDAIQHWFTVGSGKKHIKTLPIAQRKDFEKYEGNAQGFRILARLQDRSRLGGLQLTYATLAAFTKYPKESHARKGGGIHNGNSTKKFGFFQEDKELFRQIAEELKLFKRDSSSYCWARHPLAFLVEAADDIAYLIIDFEDGYRLKRIDYKDIYDPFKKIIKSKKIIAESKSIRREELRIAFLRSRVINTLVGQVSKCFLDHEKEILAGRFDEDLIGVIPARDILQFIKTISIREVYAAREVAEIEAAGFEVLGGLLNAFVSAASDVAKNGKEASKKSKKLVQLIPEQFLDQPNLPKKDDYSRILQVLDFVSGMTDSYAVSLYKKITGISLPNG